MKQPFEPTLLSCHRWGGAAAGELNPGKEAEKIGCKIHGAWLTAYMIRRFGPPNAASDDCKNLCSWSISTPMKGLALLITPYLGDDGVEDKFNMCLHFGYRWSPALQNKVRRAEYKSRGCEAFDRKLWRWTDGRLVGMYLEDVGTRKILWQSDPKDEAGKPAKVFAICQALPKGENPKAYVTKKEMHERWWLKWTIHELYRKCHKKPKPRKMPKNGWPKSMVVHRCNQALRASIRALLLPISVRDLNFTVKGRMDDDDCPQSAKFAKHFEKAGYPCRVM